MKDKKKHVELTNLWQKSLKEKLNKVLHHKVYKNGGNTKNNKNKKNEKTKKTLIKINSTRIYERFVRRQRYNYKFQKRITHEL